MAKVRLCITKYPKIGLKAMESGNCFAKVFKKNVHPKAK